MSSTSATLHRTTDGVTPQGYYNEGDAYKPAEVLPYNSSQYALIHALPYRVASVTVSTSTDGLSGAADLMVHRLAAVEMSTAWTDANITFAVASSSGGTYNPLYDDLGNEVTVTGSTANRVVAFDSIAGSLAMVRWVKLRSGTNGTPVTQAAARTLNLILKG